MYHLWMLEDVESFGQVRATCCAQQCRDLLRLNVAIVLPELTNVAGPIMLGYVVLKCCDRLAGA